MVMVVLVVSLALQLTAAVLALRLIRVTGARWAWLLIATALVLMSSRRAVTLHGLLLHRIVGADLSSELVALTISALMVVGVASIAPVFEALRRSEQRLRQSDGELREVIAAAPDGMLLMRDGLCVFASRAMSRTLGGDVTLRQRRVAELAHPDDAGAFAAWLAAETPSGAADAGAPFEVRLMRSDGEAITAEIVRGPSLEFEGALASLLVLRDHSERKLLHEQLVQSQKMEAIGQLAGGIAHDFNNLLAVITGYAELLLRDMPSGRRGREEIDEIAKAARRAAALTWQLLAFSRRQAVQPRLLDLNAAIVDVERLLERTLGNDIEIELQLADSLWVVKADLGQVEQILMNLAVNARDAMTSGGRLTIGTRNETLDETYVRRFADATAGEHVVLSVSDTGSGMDAKTLARIFEPFFTTKPIGKGTGLGLSTVYGIVRRAGGHLQVQSELGRGTTFSIHLPRAEGILESEPSVGAT